MIEMSFYFQSFIGREEIANSFFELLEKEELPPDKIGLFEPLTLSYERTHAIELWTKAEHGNKRIAGGLTGKRKRTYTFIMEWNKGEQYIRPNWLTFLIPDNAFKKLQTSFLNIFNVINQEFGGVFSYISTEEARNRQYVVGTLETRMPGIFWCNYFSKTYVDFFGKEKLINGPWISQKLLPNDAIITFLSKQPTDLVSNLKLEETAKSYLGYDSFGDRETYEQNMELQIKNVPLLNLSELRVKLD